MESSFRAFKAVQATSGRADALPDPRTLRDIVAPDPVFAIAKRAFDVSMAILALPLVVLAAIILAVLNPIWNPGPLIFSQPRMGKDCRPFTALKFRTMRDCSGSTRGPNDPLELDRITSLGRFLRRSRIDELPQVVNVLLGDMSLVGPRPDYWDHALHYVDSVPGYRQRHAVKPGITGLAQVDAGYAEGMDATFRKVHHDLAYIRRAGWRMDGYVVLRTIVVILTGSGAR